mmetsp:Transcript_55343/g.131442  ORF Transcript_55343/g.131442 Transcript_55343/m.131442 type:complete len:212 (-) Transcript_55343:738-1373(-)
MRRSEGDHELLHAGQRFLVDVRVRAGEVLHDVGLGVERGHVLLASGVRPHKLSHVVQRHRQCLGVDARARLEQLHQHLEHLLVLLEELVHVFLPERHTPVHGGPLELARHDLLAVLVEGRGRLHVLAHLVEKQVDVLLDVLVRPRPVVHALKEALGAADSEDVLHLRDVDEVHQHRQDHPDHLFLLSALHDMDEQRDHLHVSQLALDLGAV